MYEFSWPTKTLFGAGLARRIADHLTPSAAGDRLLLVAPGERWAQPLVAALKERLAAGGWAEVATFAEVEPNPTWATVARGVERATASDASTLLAVGGGSVMDAAKIITQDSGAHRLCTMPTTAGTGGEISPWAVISDLEQREKQSLIAARPELAILDPVLSTSMPPLTTLSTGIDAFVHGLEAFLSTAASPITDALALAGMHLACDQLPAVMETPDGLPGRSGMLQASLLTGAAMLNAGLGLIHAIGNVMGGLDHRLTHGLILAQCMPAVLAYNQPAIDDRLKRVSGLIERLRSISEQWLQVLEVERVAVREQDLALLVERALGNVNAGTNPRPVRAEAVEEIVRRSFEITVHSDGGERPSPSKEMSH
jgi:alcohol dehydrogenase